MLIKNLMEDKKLNLRQPLLSVRRISPTSVFGGDERTKTDNSFRTMIHPPRYKSELKSGPVRNPGAVPFLWEQIPGRPKDESIPQTRVTEKPPTVPNFPPGRKLNENQDPDKPLESPKSQTVRVENAYTDESVKNESFDRSKQLMQNKENIESEDGDEAYKDALDTLSRTESFFLNCSLSGLSGFHESDAILSGTSLTDPQTIDLMMGRFLPAAKAMASETPYYAPRKKPAIREQLRQLKKVINWDMRPQLRYGPSFALHYSQDYKEEESDDDCYDNGNLPSKVCGLLPRFCLKSSLCLLNPEPGMSVRTRVPISPVTVSRTSTGSTATASGSGMENERSISDVSERKPVVRFLITKRHEDKNDLKGSGISTYADEVKAIIGRTTTRANSADVKCLGLHKNSCQTLQEMLLSDQNNDREVDMITRVVEKTLYVDIVHEKESGIMNSCSPDTKPSKLQDEDDEILKKIMGHEPMVDSSARPVDYRASVTPYLQKKDHFNPPISAENLNNGRAMKALTAIGQAEDSLQDAIPSVKFERDVIESIRKQALLRDSGKVHPEFLVPPPLPKSPTDSWLCRTLPSLSTKNAYSRSYLGTGTTLKNQSSKTLSSDSKWETIVKRTKGHQQHLRHSEELMAIPKAQ